MTAACHTRVKNRNPETKSTARGRRLLSQHLTIWVSRANVAGLSGPILPREGQGPGEGANRQNQTSTPGALGRGRDKMHRHKSAQEFRVHLPRDSSPDFLGLLPKKHFTTPFLSV